MHSTIVTSDAAGNPTTHGSGTAVVGKPPDGSGHADFPSFHEDFLRRLFAGHRLCGSFRADHDLDSGEILCFRAWASDRTNTLWFYDFTEDPDGHMKHTLPLGRIGTKALDAILRAEESRIWGPRFTHLSEEEAMGALRAHGDACAEKMKSGDYAVAYYDRDDAEKKKLYRFLAGLD